MRIRKHASKILGSASCQAWLSSPVSRADDAEVLQGDVCELNRSPWDVTPSTSPSRANPDPDRSHLEVEEEDKGILGNEFGEAEAFCVFPSGETTREEAAIKKEIIRKEKVQVEMAEKKKAKGKTKKKKKTSGKQAAEEMEKDDITVASFKRCGKSCNKSDGKGWRCKKPAQQPHTLCRYHVAQLRAYTASTRGQVPATATAPRQRRAATVAAAETGSDFYYYYSGFGPWRRKRRSRHDADGESQIVAEEEEDADADDDNGGEHVESVDNNKDSAKRSNGNVSEDGSNVNNAEGFDVSVEDDDGSAEEDGKGAEEEEEKKRKPCHNRKRGRKRIKARSLKSLL